MSEIITAEELYRSVKELSRERAAELQPHLVRALLEFGIESRIEVAYYLGQVAHESGGFTYREEIWGPNKWQKLYDTKRDLGNWKPEAQEFAKARGMSAGRLYKGYGWIQRTGFNNIKRAAEYLGLDCLMFPELLGKDENAFRSDLLYWTDAKCASGIPSVREVTRRINPGLLHLDQRIARTEKALGVLR